MIYYLLFWTLLGLFIHFYIIFETNLLTGGPAQNCCFLPISVFRRKGISNGVQTGWNLQERSFWNKRNPGHLEWTSRSKRGGDEGARRALGRQARPPPSWPPLLFLGVGSKSPGSCSVRKSRSRRFYSIWTPFDIPFIRNTKIGKKTILGWASG